MKRHARFFKPHPPKETKEQRELKEYMDRVFRDIPWTTENEFKVKK